ncbi:hypothetical protein AX16_004436 [Volvariella volvacea WC 439]|nr:hypothetical protein AX16_004436 [Volvariella volvacea WC 439]
MGPTLSLQRPNGNALRLTKEHKELYAQEHLENFRWISRLVATRSSYVLTTSDLVPQDIVEELSEIGQFVEICYSSVPLEFILSQRETLLRKDFPLEGYAALKCISPDLVMVKSTVAQVPAFLFYCPEQKRLVVAFAGTSTPQMAMQDLRVLRQQHPSRKGNVHTGFWAIYQGLKVQLLSAIQEALEKRDWDITELVLAGHSMGSCITRLLCMDLLSSDSDPGNSLLKLIRRLKLKVVSFGAPRTGDSGLVQCYSELVEQFKQENGSDSFVDYSIKAYNDGVPALPPTYLGYSHFATQSLYFDKGMLFTTPASENEHALFSVSIEPPTLSRHPLGGHNYYNNRDMEQFLRRLSWLVKVDYQQQGWEDRYKEYASKELARS